MKLFSNVINILECVLKEYCKLTMPTTKIEYFEIHVCRIEGKTTSISCLSNST